MTVQIGRRRRSVPKEDRQFAAGGLVNLPGQFWTHLVLAMVHGQLGNRDGAARALEELLAIYPDFPADARQEIQKFFYAQRAHAERVLEGLRKAGLEIPGNPPVVETAVTSAGGSDPLPGRPVRSSER